MKTSMLLVLVLLTGCGATVAEPALQDDPLATDASSSDASDDRPYIGGPCAFTYEDGCEIRTCLDGSGKVERVTRTPIGDAGSCPDA